MRIRRPFMWMLRIDRNSNSTELTWLKYGSQ